jgi:hypothetical protein
LGLRPGDEVGITLEDGEIKIVSTQQAIERTEALVKR